MAMPDTPIAANFHKAFDIKVDIFPKLSLNLMLPVNNLPEAINLLFGKFIRLNL
jgi:hypothetical protein